MTNMVNLEVLAVSSPNMLCLLQLHQQRGAMSENNFPACNPHWSRARHLHYLMVQVLCLLLCVTLISSFGSALLLKIVMCNFAFLLYYLSSSYISEILSAVAY